MFYIKFSTYRRGHIYMCVCVCMYICVCIYTSGWFMSVCGSGQHNIIDQLSTSKKNNFPVQSHFITPKADFFFLWKVSWFTSLMALDTAWRVLQGMKKMMMKICIQTTLTQQQKKNLPCKMVTITKETWAYLSFSMKKRANASACWDRTGPQSARTSSAWRDPWRCHHHTRLPWICCRHSSP